MYKNLRQFDGGMLMKIRCSYCKKIFYKKDLLPIFPSVICRNCFRQFGEIYAEPVDDISWIKRVFNWILKKNEEDEFL